MNDEIDIEENQTWLEIQKRIKKPNKAFELFGKWVKPPSEKRVRQCGCIEELSDYWRIVFRCLKHLEHSYPMINR